MGKRSSDDEPNNGLVTEMVVGGLGGFATDGVPGALVGAGSPVVLRLAKLANDKIHASDNQAIQAWLTAAKLTNRSPDALFDIAESDPDKRHLGYRVGQVASEARMASKVVVLGEALARGLLAEDDVALDIEQQIVDSLEGVERPHLAVMWELIAVEEYPDTTSWVQRSLTWPELSEVLPQYRLILPRLLAHLTREGLVERHAYAVLGGAELRPGREDYEGVHWVITRFGMRVLAYLYKAGLPAPEGHEKQAGT